MNISSVANTLKASSISEVKNLEEGSTILPSGDINARQAYSNYEQRPKKDIYYFTEEQLNQYTSLDENAVHSTYKHLNNLNLFARVIHRVFFDGRDINMGNLSISDNMSNFWKVVTVIAGIILLPLTLVCAICYAVKNSIMNSLNQREILELMAEDELIPIKVQEGMGEGILRHNNFGLLNLLRNDKSDESPDSEDESDAKVTEPPETLYEQLKKLALSNRKATSRNESLEITDNLRAVGERLSSVSIETFMEGLATFMAQIQYLNVKIKDYESFDDSEVDINSFTDPWDGWVDDIRYGQAVQANLERIARERRPIMRSFEQVERSIGVLAQVTGNLELKDSLNNTFFSQQDIEVQILNIFLSMQGMMSFIQPQDTSQDKVEIRYNLKYCKESLRVQVEKFQESLIEWNEIKKRKEIDHCIELVEQLLKVSNQFLEFAESYNLNLQTERAAMNVENDLDDREQVMLCTELFPFILEDLSDRLSFLTYYDNEGYNTYGFNRQGFNRQGRDRDGYDRRGFNRQGRDRGGYDRQGFNSQGFDRNGFNFYGRDIRGYDRRGYDRRGYDTNGQTVYDENGYNLAGFNAEGYNRDGYDSEGYPYRRWLY